MQIVEQRAGIRRRGNCGAVGRLTAGKANAAASSAGQGQTVRPRPFLHGVEVAGERAAGNAEPAAEPRGFDRIARREQRADNLPPAFRSADGLLIRVRKCGEGGLVLRGLSVQAKAEAGFCLQSDRVVSQPLCHLGQGAPDGAGADVQLSGRQKC